MVGLDYRDTMTDFDMPPATFFDIAVVHMLTTATIDRLRALYPQGRFEARRFGPNIVVSTSGEDQGFAENDWAGRTVTIGSEVQLATTEPCPLHHRLPAAGIGAAPPAGQKPGPAGELIQVPGGDPKQSAREGSPVSSRLNRGLMPK